MLHTLLIPHTWSNKHLLAVFGIISTFLAETFRKHSEKRAEVPA